MGCSYSVLEVEVKDQEGQIQALSAALEVCNLLKEIKIRMIVFQISASMICTSFLIANLWPLEWRSRLDG